MPTPPREAWAIALVAAGSLSVLAACGGEEKKPPATAKAVQSEDASARAAGAHASGEMPEPLVTVTPAPTSDQGAPIVVREEVRAACNLPDEREEAPRFDYNEAELSDRDVEILDAVATCLERGELEGEAIRIIGHADPRGSEESNMLLGMKRAVAVREYLYEKGVPPGAIVVASQGERESSGDDEEGFALDRRVEIEIATPRESPEAPETTAEDFDNPY